MELQKLTLEHFKGMDHCELNASGCDVDVYGDNATGKTTLADAYCWLLTGKDSAGRSDTTFEIIPRGTSGLDCVVEGEFLADDGGSFTLRRVYKQVYSRKNGEAEREYKGNTTDYYIDGVPKPKRDYTAFVGTQCDERTLLLLTDPDGFAGKLKWDERRDMLLRLFAPQTSEADVIGRHAELRALTGYIGHKSVEDYIAVARERRRAINRELESIPERIDEAEKAKPRDAAPSPKDGPRLGKLQIERGKLEAEIAALQNGEALAGLRQELAELRERMAQAGAEFARGVAADPWLREQSGLRRKRRELEEDIAGEEARVRTMEARLKDDDTELTRLRCACIENHATRFDSSGNLCPTCGQPYPQEKLEELRGAWNEQKSRRQEELEQQGRAAKASRELHAADLRKREQRIIEAQKQLDEITERLVLMDAAPVPAWESAPEYQEFQRQIAAKEQEITLAQQSTDAVCAEKRRQLDEAARQIEAIRERMAGQELVKQQERRIAQLMEQEKTLGIELAAIEQGLHLADQFILAKVGDIEEQVNAAFRLVRWKLFDRQINGGIRPVCEATVDGIEYSANLNNAARINAGLDIISALSRKLGARYPVFIDNAESVTTYLPVDTQVIRLYVSAQDKQLRMEVKS